MKAKKYDEMTERDEILMRLKCHSYEFATSGRQRADIGDDLKRMLTRYGFEGKLLFEELDRRRAERGYPEMNETVAEELSALVYRCALVNSSPDKLVHYVERLEMKLKEHGFYFPGAVDALVIGQINSEGAVNNAVSGKRKGLRELFRKTEHED